MLIFIRTTGERTLEQFKNIEYTLLLDKEKTGCKGYFEQLKHLATLDDDILLLEDDIILKKSFMNCLNDLIEMTNNKYIINMSQPNGVVKLFEPKQFYWTRAVYYPKGSLNKLMMNYSEDMLSISKYYDVIQQSLMFDKYIGVPSVMNIIDTGGKSLMNYK